MSLSLEALWKMSDVELLAAYYDVRRQHIERKFARDTQRARLREALKASQNIKDRPMLVEVVIDQKDLAPQLYKLAATPPT